MEAIEVSGLTKTYDGRNVVDGLTLTVHEGELFALLGVNGAGKTTTIRMLTGLTAPDGGDARICGHSIRTQLPLVKRAVGICPQETAVAKKLTVRENVTLMARLYGQGKGEAARSADALIGEFGLSEVAEKRAGKLSGGWQRRLSIAMAMAGRPKVLFLDEPTVGLDVLARRALWELIRGALRHMTIVLTTHSMEEAEALASRIGIMAAGRLRACGAAPELMEQTGTATLEDAFVALAQEGGAA